jgi:hypothetical protein
LTTIFGPEDGSYTCSSEPETYSFSTDYTLFYPRIRTSTKKELFEKQNLFLAMRTDLLHISQIASL